MSKLSRRNILAADCLTLLKFGEFWCLVGHD